jgi:hypothetical protein
VIRPQPRRRRGDGRRARARARADGHDRGPRRLPPYSRRAADLLRGWAGATMRGLAYERALELAGPRRARVPRAGGCGKALGVVPEDVVHPGLLGGWWCRSHQSQGGHRIEVAR